MSSSSPGGILQAHPPPWAYPVNRVASRIDCMGLRVDPLPASGAVRTTV